ncbi:hypothetical protein GN956_G25576 [Arapaima gigas]
MCTGDHTACQVLSWFFYTLFLPHAALAQGAVQPHPVMEVQLGQRATLTCFTTMDEVFYFLWYKQPFGQKPQLMARAYGDSEEGQFQGEFKGVTRFSAKRSKKRFNLTISNVEVSDAAAYFCATEFLDEITFGDGTFLVLTGRYY